MLHSTPLALKTSVRKSIESQYLVLSGDPEIQLLFDKEATTGQGEKMLMIIRETGYEFISEVVELGEMNIKRVQNEFVSADIGTKDFTAIGDSC